MTFIPNPRIINSGDRVRLTNDYHYQSGTYYMGTYTKGHEFEVGMVEGYLEHSYYELRDGMLVIQGIPFYMLEKVDS